LSVVVDSSVVVAALVDTGDNGGVGGENSRARRPIRRLSFLRVEAANVLRRLERGKEITEQEANAAFEDLIELEIELHAFEPFSERVWELRHKRDQL